MSDENIISANQMINKIFQNITVQEDEKSISAVWRKTVLKVYNYGEKLAHLHSANAKSPAQVTAFLDEQAV